MARLRRATIPLALCAAAFALALVQRPGWSSSDTKIDLHTGPVRFLGELVSLWTPSSGLGGVESAQYAGYLFPMGPFFALGHAFGLHDWLVDRLWLGLLLAVGCLGVARLLETLGAVRSRAGLVAAAGLYLLNPYVVVLTNRTTITLLAYALLPWIVLITWRGLREPRRWRWAATFALLVASSGGGVNAAVVALPLLAPLALAIYEPLTGAVGWRDVRAFMWRAVAGTLVASLWWIAPAAAQAKYGVDFLRFTEPAGAVWATTSLSESFRLMGYWISYIGVGFNGTVTPYLGDSDVLLFFGPVILATFLVPGLVLLGFAWTRTRRYAAYFLLLVLAGTLVMTTGFPEGTPLRRGATFAYNHFSSVRFLRTTYKAGPLVALGIAGLAGMAVERGVSRLAARRRYLGIAEAALAACLVLALSVWPLVRGKAIDKQVSWKHIPAAWRAAGHELDHSLGDDHRAIVLPGQLYAFYRWGATVDPILPALTRKPVAVRNAVPYGDLRGTDLLWTTDALVQQERLLPGQLPGLLRLMSVSDVVTATDDNTGRSGATEPWAAAHALAGQGLRPVAAYGAARRFAPPTGRVGRPFRLPPVRVARIGGGRPLVRVEARSPLMVVDGSAEGLAELAGFGVLPAHRAFTYAGDLGRAAMATAARAGGTIVVTDSNRRRVQVVSRMQQNTGATLGAGDPISEDAATLDPFPRNGSAGQTVAVYHGARWIRAPFSPGYRQFPENRPFAAFDGNPRTAWFADRALDPGRHWVEVGFDSPRDVPYVDVLPRDEAAAHAIAVRIGGHRFALRSGWTHIPLHVTGAGSLRVRVVTGRGRSPAAAGLAEVRIPGVHVTESLRPPLNAETGLRGADLKHATLAYAFSRSRGDRPWQHARSAGADLSAYPAFGPDSLEYARTRFAGDEEAGLDRVIDPPVTRAYDARAWVSVTPEAADSALDRLAGYRGPLTVNGGPRFEGRPAFRASSALDGDPRTFWAGASHAGARPSLRIHSRRIFRVRTMRLVAGPKRLGVPTVVRVRWDGGTSRRLRVVRGRVVLPRAVSTRALTLYILESNSHLAAVGMAELRIPGLGPMKMRRRGPLPGGCGALTVATAGGTLRLRARGDLRTLDHGRPIRARSCGPVLRLPAGPQRLRTKAGALRIDDLLLTSPAPAPLARVAASPGAVTDPGSPGRGRREGVGLSVNGPAWLVLGESYDSGWRATCSGHSLGRPVPLDGYANAWPVGPSCTKATFNFAPQRPVRILQLLSALACLVLLAMALIPGRAWIRSEQAADLPAREHIEPVPLRRAAVIGLLAGAALAFCFSLRSGLLIAPGIAFVLWWGIPARLLALAAGLLIAVLVPVLYIAFPSDDHGGYNPGYAGDHVAGHWVAVAAWVLLALALFRTVRAATSPAREG